MKEFEASHADYLGKDESKQKKTVDFPTLRENSASLWRIEAKGKSGLGASRRDLDTARETQRSKNHTTFFQVKSSPENVPKTQGTESGCILGVALP